MNSSFMESYCGDERTLPLWMSRMKFIKAENCLEFDEGKVIIRDGRVILQQKSTQNVSMVTLADVVMTVTTVHVDDEQLHVGTSQPIPIEESSNETILLVAQGEVVVGSYLVKIEENRIVSICRYTSYQMIDLPLQDHNTYDWISDKDQHVVPCGELLKLGGNTVPTHELVPGCQINVAMWLNQDLDSDRDSDRDSDYDPNEEESDQMDEEADQSYEVGYQQGLEFGRSNTIHLQLWELPRSIGQDAFLDGYEYYHPSATSNVPEIITDPRYRIFMDGIDESWYTFIGNESPLIKTVLDTLLKNSGEALRPKASDIFAIFRHPFHSYRVAIIGQDPYPTIGHAHGYAFSSKASTMPKSLQAIQKEIMRSYPQSRMSSRSDLTCWVNQGVLLINTTLTFRGQAEQKAHKILWRGFAIQVLQRIARHRHKLRKPLILVAWGRDAEDVTRSVQNVHTLVSGHPSPLAQGAANPFAGCKHFTLINQKLRDMGEEEILWDF